VKEFLEARPEKKVVIDDPVAMTTFAVNEMLHRGVSAAMNKAQSTVMFAEDVTDDQEKRETTQEMDRMCVEVEERLREEQDESHKQAIGEELRRLEELRLQLEQAKAEQRRKLLERERKRQALMQKLARIGLCPAGYVWIREGSGFRCGGGSHFVTFAQLDLTADDAKELGL
jgi:transposase